MWRILLINILLKQLPIDDESKANLVRVRIGIFFDASDALAEQMFTGQISLGQWQEDMKRIIRESHTSCAAIGKGGWGEMGAKDWGRLGTPLREQYKYLRGFADFISENRDTVSLAAIRARARLYGEGAGGSAVLMQAGAVFEDILPWIPKDGSTECLNRCKCHWELSVTGTQSDGFRQVRAVWVLSVAEHCNTCVGRDGHVETFVVPAGTVVPDMIGGI